MLSLYEELWRRFPEVRDLIEGDAELPYLVMGALGRYLATLQRTDLDNALVSRVVSFAKWCEDQPRGTSASDDMYTILAVAFYEHLFEHDTTRALIPHLIDRDELDANEWYLKSWVGENNFNLAKSEYAQHGRLG